MQTIIFVQLLHNLEYSVTNEINNISVISSNLDNCVCYVFPTGHFVFRALNVQKFFTTTWQKVNCSYFSEIVVD